MYYYVLYIVTYSSLPRRSTLSEIPRVLRLNHTITNLTDDGKN